MLPRSQEVANEALFRWFKPTFSNPTYLELVLIVLSYLQSTSVYIVSIHVDSKMYTDNVHTNDFKKWIPPNLKFC